MGKPSRVPQRPAHCIGQPLACQERNANRAAFVWADTTLQDRGAPRRAAGLFTRRPVLRKMAVPHCLQSWEAAARRGDGGGWRGCAGAPMWVVQLAGIVQLTKAPCLRSDTGSQVCSSRRGLADLESDKAAEGDLVAQLLGDGGYMLPARTTTLPPRWRQGRAPGTGGVVGRGSQNWSIGPAGRGALGGWCFGPLRNGGSFPLAPCEALVYVLPRDLGQPRGADTFGPSPGAPDASLSG